MSKISKFLENELDRVNDYLGMAKANLIVATELCQDKCEKITNKLTEEDFKINEYLNDELPKLETKICAAKNLIKDFKNYTYDLEKS